MELNREYVPPEVEEESRILGEKFFALCNDDALYNGMNLAVFDDKWK